MPKWLNFAKSGHTPTMTLHSTSLVLVEETSDERESVHGSLKFKKWIISFDSVFQTRANEGARKNVADRERQQQYGCYNMYLQSYKRCNILNSANGIAVKTFYGLYFVGYYLNFVVKMQYSL